MNETIKRSMSGLVYVAVMWCLTYLHQESFYLLYISLLIISIYEMIKLRKDKSKILPFIYVLLPFSLIIPILQEGNTWEEKIIIILHMYVLIWSFDTFAYLFGKNFGKHKILKTVSPKKSWEGFIFGFITTIIIAYIIEEYVNININYTYNLIVISSFIPFTATTGDLIMSYYKRKAKVKDSGKLIPGHGGFLDRIDSFTITIPCIYIYLQIIKYAST